jgi:hypothetical protein
MHQSQVQHILPFSPNQPKPTCEQRPAAPLPLVNSMNKPEPHYPDRNTAEFVSEQFYKSKQNSVDTDGPPRFNNTRPHQPVNDGYSTQNSKRNSANDPYNVEPPVIRERLIIGRDPVLRQSLTFTGADQANFDRDTTITRSNSDSNWSSPTSASSPTTPRTPQNKSYLRQVTLTTIPQNEVVPPIPGKTASKTGKIRILLIFDKPFFNAGAELSGRLEIQCSSSRSVMLADMIIELLGYESRIYEVVDLLCILILDFMLLKILN